MPRAKTTNPALKKPPGPRSNALKRPAPAPTGPVAALEVRPLDPNPDLAAEARTQPSLADVVQERQLIHPAQALVSGQEVSVQGGTADAILSPQRTTDELSAEDELAADIARIRGLRRPLGSFAQKLAIEPIPGYHQHWFNDAGARLDEARANGWAHVNDQDGKPKRRPVGMGRDNGVMYAYVMKLPMVFWQEDIDARHADARQRVDQLKAQPFKTRPGDRPDASDERKFYSPTAGGDALQVVKG